MVYLHGGGYVAGLDRQHWHYAARLVRGLGVRVVLPDYPLAPAHTWRDSLAPVADLVQQAAAVAAGVVLMGDSAGGGLAVAVAQELVRGAASRSPTWCCSRRSSTSPATPRGPSRCGSGRPVAEAEQGADLRRLVERRRAADPEASPLAATSPGCRRCWCCAAPATCCMPQAREMVRRVRAAGGAVDYVEAPGLLHVYPLLPVPEARAAWRRVRAFL